MKTVIFFLACLFTASNYAVAEQKQILSELTKFSLLQVRYDGFRLEQNQQIIIHTGHGGSRSSAVQANVWILNSQSRECVWNSRKDPSDIVPIDEERSFSVQLPKGTYELYGVLYPASENVNGFEDLIDLLGKKLFEWGRHDRTEFKEFTVRVEGGGTRLGTEEVTRLHDAMQQGALVSFLRTGDDENLKQSFRVAEKTELDIYCIGEITGDDAVDYGGIQNMETGELIWSLRRAHSQPAGGSRKNRMVHETITLPAGSYLAFYTTDDSHSYTEWNAAPPRDPVFWGLTIRAVSTGKKAPQRIEQTALFDRTIVSLTKLKDNAAETKGFSLKKPADVRLYAIGEGVNGEMTDYGWILNHTTQKKIWIMSYDETEHAGGAEKNRMANKVLHLDKGDYTVHFVTDGSHSYRRWNATPPFDQAHWGITVSAIDPSFDPGNAVPYSEENDPRYLVRMVGIRDDEDCQQEFTLAHKQALNIYALGESDVHTMVDYGWITNASGEIVWKMRYSETERAGGAKKNRLFDGTITLPAGTYVAHYESDGSHSFGNWNDAPPDDQLHWGITITRKEK